MALAFDSESQADSGVGASSISVSHTCTGSNLVLVSYVWSNADDVTSVTYNGVGMTQFGTAQQNAANAQYLTGWTLVAPATGAHNLVANHSGGGRIRVTGISYTGAKQSGQPDAFNSRSASESGNAVVSVTVVAANCWLTAASYSNDVNEDGVVNGVTRGTAFNEVNNPVDSNGVVGTGAQTIGWHYPSADQHMQYACSIAPFVATTNNFLTLLGVGT